MVINESALYEGKLWCAYDLKYRDGTYNEELRLAMRKESQANKFICPDCGEHLILCAGTIMEPFFKHHTGSECVVQKERGTKNLAARRMLYQMAQDSFPEQNISVNVKLTDSLRPCVLIETEEQAIVLEYLSQEITLTEWLEKHEMYENSGIRDIWFLSSRKYNNDRISTFEYQIQKAGMTINLIDVMEQKLILKTAIRHKRGRHVLLRHYPFQEILLDEEGEFQCDFQEYCREIGQKIEEELAQWLEYERNHPLEIMFVSRK